MLTFTVMSFMNICSAILLSVCIGQVGRQVCELDQYQDEQGLLIKKGLNLINILIYCFEKKKKVTNNLVAENDILKVACTSNLVETVHHAQLPFVLQVFGEFNDLTKKSLLPRNQ